MKSERLVSIKVVDKDGEEQVVKRAPVDVQEILSKNEEAEVVDPRWKKTPRTLKRDQAEGRPADAAVVIKEGDEQPDTIVVNGKPKPDPKTEEVEDKPKRGRPAKSKSE